MTTMKPVFTSLVVALLSLPTLAQSLPQITTIQDKDVVMTIEQVNQTTVAPSPRAKLFSAANDCSKTTSASLSSTGRTMAANGGVVFDDGVSGTIVTGDPKLDVILNIGKQAWKLIQANAPVVSTKLASANALPQGIQCWNQLEKWQGITTSDFKITVKSIYTNDVVRYVARLVYAHGGSYKGKGRYIANAAIQNKEIMVLWSNVLNVDVEIPQVLNAGTVDNPVAVMQINVNIQTKNNILPLIHHENTIGFVISGDGRPVQVL